MKNEQRQKIIEIFEKCLNHRAKTIQEYKLNKLDLNPFLIRLLSKEMNLSDSKSIIRFLILQHFERGTVTSFGMTLQEIAKLFSEGTGVEGADILKIKNGRHYHIQVKSGPNTVPKDMAERISELLLSAQRRNRGSVAMFGMCYGNPQRVSSIVKKYVKVDSLVGKEFWSFISDDPKCIDEIYEIAKFVSETYKIDGEKNLSQILEEKLLSLENEFNNTYGSSGDEMWQKLLNLNS